MPRIFPTLLILALGSTFALVLPAPTRAQSPLAPHLGPVASAVEPGQDGAWTIGSEGGWATFRNSTEPGSVRYYWTDLPQMAETDFAARVTLFAQSGGSEPQNAGLLFNYKAPDSYFAVTISSDGTPYVVVRNADGFSPKALDTTAARLDGSDILEVKVEGTTVHATLNGDTLIEATFGAPVSRKTGVIVYGTGVSGLTGLTVEPIATGDTLPIPGGGSTLPTPGGDSPAPTPGGGNTPPPIPGQDGNTPPPIPGQGGDTPPPVPGQGADTPPPIPGQTGPSDPPPIPGQTQDTPIFAGLTQEQAAARMGVALGIFLHEMAHAVIGETGLPATGPEEDTADSFSAFTMSNLLEGATPESHDYLVKVIENSALHWYFISKKLKQNEIAHDWQDEHAPDIKRFRNSFCIIFGSNPQIFQTVADRVNFTERSRSRCAYEYESKLNAWEELLALRGRNLGEDVPGAFPANQPGGKLNLVFQPSQSQFGRETEAMLKYGNLVPLIVQFFEKYFVWPRDVTITFRDCDQINAWYDPRDASVTMCYSLIEVYGNVLMQGISAN